MKVIVYCMFLLGAVSAAPHHPSSETLVATREARPFVKADTSLQNLQQEDFLVPSAESSLRPQETDTETESRLTKQPSIERTSNSTHGSYMPIAISRHFSKPQSETKLTSGGRKAINRHRMAPTAAECASSILRRSDRRDLTKRVQPRIVNGVEAEHGEIPYQVSIQVVEFIDFEHVCGGAVVSNRFVITSANCVTGRSLSALLVVAGEYSLSSSLGFEQKRDVVNIIVHPEYAYLSSPVNDIAILELSGPLTFGFNVASIALALEVAPPSTPCRVTGWGTTSVGGQHANILQKLTVTVMNDQQCIEAYGDGEIIGDRMVCAVDYDTDGDFCQGDEGGPLECNGYLHGLASWGTGCDSGCPGVYTKVFHYADWIKGVIGQSENALRMIGQAEG